MTLVKYFQQKRLILKTHLTTFLVHKKNQSSIPLYKDVVSRLVPFLTAGKMLRGILVIFSCEMFNRKVNEDVLNTASALELAHSALLIHDDIIDRDTLRRGQKTIFAQYIDYAKRGRIKDPNSYGQSMGICVGDIAFFLSFELLSKLSIESTTQQELAEKFANEMQTVGTGEMFDIDAAERRNNPTLEQIFDIYRYKTARYTFSLPLTLGGILVGSNNSIIRKLEKLGELFGIIFQIKDDELGLFGEEIEIGKPVGSDIRENKKTIWRLLLYQHAKGAERSFLDSCFGNEKVKKQEIGDIQQLIKKYRIRELIEGKIRQFTKESISIIKNLPIKQSYKRYLVELVEYNVGRKG